MRTLLSTAALACAFLLAACGGGGGGGGGTPAAVQAAAPSANVAVITVDAGPVVNGSNTARPNIPTVSVTICVPGTANCQSVDHVQIDTGSAGLRLVNTPALAALGLPEETASNGGTLAECAQFADGVTWGTVRTADVRVSGEIAGNIPIQIINDAATPNVPSACSNFGSPKQSVNALGANGILGLGTLAVDCGPACAQQVVGLYYGCTSASSCPEITVPVAQQVPNPVTHFATNNNGTLVQLPAIGAQGAATVQGSLIFGIGTQGNNALGSAQVYTTTAGGVFTATYNGTTLNRSLLDTGSNALFFPDSSIAVCASNAPGFYCPATTVPVSVKMTGMNGATTTVNLSVGNALALFSASGAFAYNNIGGPFPGMTFDFGLPFFYGRSVYTAITGANTPGGAGPYVAF
ncbi:DUF3443 domain-containing protein [Pararobbsia alpina]|uniref:DUF3443 domain-containing protein n=1 Tax=Pararobbsia alpina TaxID=621374 RepID=A0A6S7BBA7_9BURK|nr:DUF3443 domain-containing protein [Pararobbsia alpina]CAB3794263.1 hypothetical protein LMG28138_03657 [Pararobbsia alpina]